MDHDIFNVVNLIPSGQTMSYGEVARQAGYFRGARLVGWALRRLPKETKVPWYRVINQKGYLTIINPHFTSDEQKVRLEAEGVKLVLENNLWRVV